MLCGVIGVWASGEDFAKTNLRDTLIKTGDEKNYVWTKVAPNPSRIHKTTKNMILCKNLMFIFSLIPSFSRYCRSKNDHARLSCRISFMKTCSPYASVSANLSKICTFLWPISVAKNAVQGSQPPISSSVLNNVSLNTDHKHVQHPQKSLSIAHAFL